MFFISDSYQTKRNETNRLYVKKSDKFSIRLQIARGNGIYARI